MKHASTILWRPVFVVLCICLARAQDLSPVEQRPHRSAHSRHASHTIDWQNVRAVLELKKTERNDVLLHTFNLKNETSPEVLLLKNFFKELQKWGHDANVVAISNDKRSCEIAWDHGIPVFFDADIAPRHTDSVVTKWIYTNVTLSHGYNVLFMDWDVVLNRMLPNVFTRDADIEMLSDSLTVGVPPSEVRCDVEYKGAVPCVSTGFWWMRPTTTTMKLVEHVINASQQDWEQAVFNRIIYSYIFAEYDALRVKILPKHIANNLKAVVNLQNYRRIAKHSDLFVVHCGYEHGFQGKVSCLQQAGGWDPDAFVPGH